MMIPANLLRISARLYRPNQLNILSWFFVFHILDVTAPALGADHHTGEKRVNTTEEEHVDRLIEPEYFKYLKEVARVLTDSGFTKHPDVEKAIGTPEHMKTPQSRNYMKIGFESLDPQILKQLGQIKTQEINRLRRKIIPRKKGVVYKDHVGTDHLKMSITSFGIEDLYALLDANLNHNEKYRKMRKEDFKNYEMHKRFRDEQKARHIRDENKRKEFLEQKEKERAEYTAAKEKEKAPLTKDEIKEVWEDKDGLPEEEFNPKTFFALHDTDGNGLLDLDEVRMLIANQVNRTFGGTSVDERERMEELENLRDHIYKNVDRNRDLMIDMNEFLKQIERETQEQKGNKNIDDYQEWKPAEDQDEDYNDEEFEKFKKREIEHIREDFGNGRKPEGYDYQDVPLLDENFINETHVKVGNEIFKANDTPKDQRREAFKKYEMEKKFEMEQKIRDMNDIPEAERQKQQHDLDELYYNGSHGLHPNEADTHMNEPLSPEQLETVWEEQDHKTKQEWNATVFFHLHDVNQDSLIDAMELRLMLVTELSNNEKDFDEVEKEEELERLKDNVLEEADKDKDGKLDLNEFLQQVNLQIRRRQEEEEQERYWKTLHEETQFTEEEYVLYRTQKTLEIRKLIAEGLIPEKYNYSHVPLLQGNFMNNTHIQRGSDIINIHDQDPEQRRADFKKFKMEAQYKHEERRSRMTPEEISLEDERIRKQNEEWQKKKESMNEPLSKDEVIDVWLEEDKMEEQAYSEEKFFLLHDIDKDGQWSHQEVRHILLKELSKMYANNTEASQIEKIEQLQVWMEQVFEQADVNKDAQISLQEFSDFQKWKQSSTQKPTTLYAEEEYQQLKNRQHPEPNTQ